MATKAMELISNYIDLKNKFSMKFAKKLVADMWKQYVDVDTATVEVGANNVDIEGFSFHIVDREQVEMECDVTDHYIDTNRPVQDHIAWKPVKLTLIGRVGEYFNNVADNKGHSVAYYQVMGNINAYLPKNPQFDMVRKVKSEISRLTIGNDVVNRITNTLTSNTYGILLGMLKQLKFDLITPFEEQVKLEKAKQTNAFLQLQGLWQAGLPLTVKTSWRTYEDMIITSVKPLRDGSADITEFSVTLKQLSLTQSLTMSSKTAKERTANQKAETVNNGKTTGINVPLPN